MMAESMCVCVCVRVCVCVCVCVVCKSTLTLILEKISPMATINNLVSLETISFGELTAHTVANPNKTNRETPGRRIDRET